MFGNMSYRYPKTAILLSAVNDLFIPYILQTVVILRWDHLLFGHTSLFLILILPCLTVSLTADRVTVYCKMYDMACRDIKIQQTLSDRPDINREDYLLWAAMEAFNLYQTEHYDELQALKQRYVTAACISVLLQALFEPML